MTKRPGLESLPLIVVVHRGLEERLLQALVVLLLGLAVAVAIGDQQVVLLLLLLVAPSRKRSADIVALLHCTSNDIVLLPDFILLTRSEVVVRDATWR